MQLIPPRIDLMGNVNMPDAYISYGIKGILQSGRINPAELQSRALEICLIRCNARNARSYDH